MYIYPNNLKPKVTLWIWQPRGIGIIGVCVLISILALAQANLLLPIVVTIVYAFLTIRPEDTGTMDFIGYACSFFFTRQRLSKWRYGT